MTDEQQADKLKAIVDALNRLHKELNDELKNTRENFRKLSVRLTDYDNLRAQEEAARVRRNLLDGLSRNEATPLRYPDKKYGINITKEL